MQIEKRKKTKQRHSHSGKCSVSKCVGQSILLPKQLCLQMFIAMSRWSGLRSVDSATLSLLESH